MYPEEYDQEQESPNFFEAPEAIARHIFEIIKSKAGVVNKDSSRANLNKVEMRAVRANGDLISDLAYAEKVCNWDLTYAKEYIGEKIATTNVPSRSKHGYGIWMAKTDRHISQPEAESMQNQINSEFNEEEVEQELQQKAGIPIIGRFLKKKEM
jgi:hypothetical protein